MRSTSIGRETFWTVVVTGVPIRMLLPSRSGRAIAVASPAMSVAGTNVVAITVPAPVGNTTAVCSSPPPAPVAVQLEVQS